MSIRQHERCKAKPSSASAGKTNFPSRARPRHSDKWFARSPYRAATAFTVTPGFRLSATLSRLGEEQNRMKASKFSDAQKAFILKQGEEGTPVAEIWGSAAGRC